MTGVPVVFVQFNLEITSSQPACRKCWEGPGRVGQLGKLDPTVLPLEFWMRNQAMGILICPLCPCTLDPLSSSGSSTQDELGRVMGCWDHALRGCSDAQRLYQGLTG